MLGLLQGPGPRGPLSPPSGAAVEGDPASGSGAGKKGGSPGATARPRPLPSPPRAGSRGRPAHRRLSGHPGAEAPAPQSGSQSLPGSGRPLSALRDRGAPESWGRERGGGGGSGAGVRAPLRGRRAAAQRTEVPGVPRLLLPPESGARPGDDAEPAPSEAGPPGRALAGTASPVPRTPGGAPPGAAPAPRASRLPAGGHSLGWMGSRSPVLFPPSRPAAPAPPAPPSEAPLRSPPAPSAARPAPAGKKFPVRAAEFPAAPSPGCRGVARGARAAGKG